MTTDTINSLPATTVPTFFEVTNIGCSIELDAAQWARLNKLDFLDDVVPTLGPLGARAMDYDGHLGSAFYFDANNLVDAARVNEGFQKLISPEFNSEAFAAWARTTLPAVFASVTEVDGSMAVALHPTREDALTHIFEDQLAEYGPELAGQVQQAVLDLRENGNCSIAMGVGHTYEVVAIDDPMSLALVDRLRGVQPPIEGPAETGSFEPRLVRVNGGDVDNDLLFLVDARHERTSDADIDSIILGVVKEFNRQDQRNGEACDDADRTPIDFTWSPATVGTVKLLSDMDDGSGAAVTRFVEALRGGSEAQRDRAPDGHRTLTAAVSAMVGAAASFASSQASSSGSQYPGFQRQPGG